MFPLDQTIGFHDGVAKLYRSRTQPIALRWSFTEQPSQVRTLFARWINPLKTCWQYLIPRKTPVGLIQIKAELRT